MLRFESVADIMMIQPLQNRTRNTKVLTYIILTDILFEIHKSNYLGKRSECGKKG